MTSIIFENSIWPNGIKDDTEGYAIFYPLGTNKVTVPASKWPKGDKYISPFVYENEKLVGFIDSASLTLDESLMIYLPYEYIDIKFPNIEKGTLQIHAPNATTKKASWKDSGKEDIPEAQFKYKDCTTVDDVKTVDANYQTTDIVDGVWSEPLWDLGQSTNMFSDCINLTSFNSDLPSLTDGDSMFSYCTKLTSFNSDLPSLTDGYCMFFSCENLASFNSDLPNLTNGETMFSMCENLVSFSSDLSNLMDGESMFSYCTKLTSFNSDLSNLTNGHMIFHNCTNLTTFSSDLSNLTDGSYMFDNCFNLTSFSSDLPSLTEGNSMFEKCKLVSFSSDLSSLTNGQTMFKDCSNLTSFSSDLFSLKEGYRMFEKCKLNAQSVANIVHTLSTYESHWEINIGIGCDDTEADQLLFARECDCETWQELLDKFSAKNWRVTFQCNGRPTEVATYGLRSGETLPIYAKLEEVTMPTDENEHKPHYDYTSQDGSKFYNINYFHSTNGSTEGYTQFNSLEEAIETLNIKPIERN